MSGRVYLELRVDRRRLRLLDLGSLADRDVMHARRVPVLQRVELHPPAAGPEAALIFGSVSDRGAEDALERVAALLHMHDVRILAHRARELDA